MSTFLFRTEDDIDIHEGMEWFYVKLSNYQIAKTNTLNYNGNKENKVEVKRFSTYQAAQKFAAPFIRRGMWIVSIPWGATYHILGKRYEVEKWVNNRIENHTTNDHQLLIAEQGGVEIELASNQIILSVTNQKYEFSRKNRTKYRNFSRINR